MSEVVLQPVLSAFLVFCRIGGCLMLMPGFASTRVPMRVRLLLVVAISLAMSPLLMPALEGLASVDAPAQLFRAISSESFKGILIGFIGRLFLAAVEFAGNAIASLIGFGALPGTPIEGTEPVPALGALIVLSATLFMFVLDLHLMVLMTIVDSYRALPPEGMFEAQPSLVALTNKLSETTLLAGRLAAPFIIYSILINLAMGLTNKLTPQIPVFFVSLPFIIAGGLFVFWFTIHDLLRVFAHALSSWLGTF
ncbi:MAG: flagellar biosynthetic protein FliR [Aestuariivirgaceae bacterium]